MTINKQAGQDDVPRIGEQMTVAFHQFAAYMRAATTPGTKLVSSGSLTRRHVLAANAAHQLIRVNTTRVGGDVGLTDGEYVEVMPVPLPHDRGGVLQYITPDPGHAAVPGIADALPQGEERVRKVSRLGTETTIRNDRPEWGFTAVLQDCVREWALHGTTAAKGDRRAREISFANAQILAFDPETLGRMTLNPPTKGELPPGNPFAPLMALTRMLAESADRAVLYRALGLEMMKMTYGLRARNIADPRGMGLKPEPQQHETAELLGLARVHAEFDPGVNHHLRDLTGETRQALLTAVRSVYRPASK